MLVGSRCLFEEWWTFISGTICVSTDRACSKASWWGMSVKTPPLCQSISGFFQVGCHVCFCLGLDYVRIHDTWDGVFGRSVGNSSPRTTWNARTESRFQNCCICHMSHRLVVSASEGSMCFDTTSLNTTITSSLAHIGGSLLCSVLQMCQVSTQVGNW